MCTPKIISVDHRKLLNEKYLFEILSQPDEAMATFSEYLNNSPDVKELFPLFMKIALLYKLKTIDWSSVKEFDECGILRRMQYPSFSKNTIVDVGAHIGTSCIHFAQNDWQVIAFEPEPGNHEELCKNLGNADNITIIPKAVSDVSGQKVPFYVSSEHWGIHSLKPFHPTQHPTLMVETVRLDETLAELKVDDVTVLKIDIEGADFLALRSFDFKRYLPQIVICEYMDERSEMNFGYNHHDMVRYMVDFGYSVFISEWAPIKEYGRKGKSTARPKFLQCVPYPLDHSPAWGNLIFVPQERVIEFTRTLIDYLGDVGKAQFLPSFMSTAKKDQYSEVEQENEYQKTQNTQDTDKPPYGKKVGQKSGSFDDMIQLLVELNGEGRNGLPVLWEDCERNYLPDNYIFLSHHQFLKEAIAKLQQNSRSTSWLHWVASGLLKFYLLPLDLMEQKAWLRKLQFLLFNIEEKLQTRSIEKLDLTEQYFLSAIRYCIASLYLGKDLLLLDNRQFFADIHFTLVRMGLWKLGCLDQYDIDLLGRIRQSTDSLKPGTSLGHEQYFPCLALMLYRKPARLAVNLDSDLVFSSYLNEFQSERPHLKNNIYLSRFLAERNQPEEYALWYLENYEGISSYWNRRKGESCFIIGNGPSLRQMDLSPLRHCITFGLNKIYLLFDKLGFETTYLVAANPYVVQQAAREFSSLSVPQFIAMWGRQFIQKRDNVVFLRENNQSLFMQDITKGVCIDCTVTYMAMQIAYYMGFETVILIGVDHSFESKGDSHKTVKLEGDDPNHFDPNYFGYGTPWQLPDLEGSEKAYLRAKTVFEADGRQIVDATAGGKLQIFPKISYEDALKLT